MRGIVLLALTLCGSGEGLANPLRDAYRAFEKKNYAESEGKFRDKLNSQPQDATVLHNLGLTLLEQKKFQEAQAVFTQAIAQASGTTKSRIFYHRSLASIGLKQWDTAEKDLIEALAFDNEHKPSQENLAWVREQKEKQESQSKEQKPEQQPKDQEKSEEEQEQKQQEGQDQKQQEGQEQKQQEGQEQKQQEGQEQKQQEGQGEKREEEAQKSPGSMQPRDTKDNPKAAVLSTKELELQEAQKLLRSLDDKIGRYPLQELQQEKGKKPDGKDW